MSRLRGSKLLDTGCAAIRRRRTCGPATGPALDQVARDSDAAHPAADEQQLHLVLALPPRVEDGRRGLAGPRNAKRGCEASDIDDRAVRWGPDGRAQSRDRPAVARRGRSLPRSAASSSSSVRSSTRRKQVSHAPPRGRRHGSGGRASRRREAERRSRAGADEAARGPVVEQDRDTPGALPGGKEARQSPSQGRGHSEMQGSRPTQPLPASCAGMARASASTEPQTRAAASQAARLSASARAYHQPEHAHTRTHPAARAGPRRAAGQDARRGGVGSGVAGGSRSFAVVLKAGCGARIHTQGVVLSCSSRSGA